MSPLNINSADKKKQAQPNPFDMGGATIMRYAGLNRPIDLPGAAELQQKVNQMVDGGKWAWLKGSSEEAIKSVGSAKYERAGDVKEDYSRSVDVLGQYYAAPGNYEQLRVSTFALMHDFVGSADRETAERILREATPLNKKGRPIKESPLTAFNKTKEQFGNVSGEDKARHLKAALDVLNSANKHRYEFASKHGMLKEFGFTKEENGKSVPLPFEEIPDPERLKQTLDACDAAHAKHQISLKVDEHGNQHKKLEKRQDWKDAMKHIFGAMVSGDMTWEGKVGLTVGRAIHHGVVGLAAMAGLTDRSSWNANTIDVGSVKQVETIRGAMVVPLKGPPPKPTPRPEEKILEAMGIAKQKSSAGGGMER